MYKLCFFVPEQNLEQVKAAIFKAGAGKLGNYEYCCWQTMGQGQFRPLEGSVPAIGQQGALEVLPEWKVETVCATEVLADVVSALKSSHPYEEVAYEYWLINQGSF